MNRPAKLGRKNTAEAPTQKPGAKPRRPSSRNPPKELNSCSLPPTRSRDVPKWGFFGFTVSSSSSSSSSCSSSSSFSRSKSLPRDPKLAPRTSKTLRSFENPEDLSELRSGGPSENPTSRTRFDRSKQVRASKPQKPTDHMQWWNCGKVGSEVPFQKKNAEARGRGAAMAKHTSSALGRRAPPPLAPEVALEKSGTPVGKISCGSILNSTPGKDGGHQLQQCSQTPKSTGTATPPVQASISPEILRRQSGMPTPACFAAGHLLAGVRDRRKCRPRGILNGGAGGMETEGNQRLRSLSDDGGNYCRDSLTPPLIMEASMRWLPSPCDDGNGRLMGISSRVSLKDCPAEACVDWLLSPSEYATNQDCAADNFLAGSSTSALNGESLSSTGLWSIFPDAIVNSAGNSPDFKGLVSLTSSSHESGTCDVGICCSPSNNSSISPFSMILQKVPASASYKDLSPREDRERCLCSSLVDISPLSGDSCGNVICAPSCPSSNRQVDSMPTLALHTLAHGDEPLSSSSPLSQALTGGSKSFLPLSALSFRFSHTSTSSNSVDLACFQMPSCHQTSVREECSTGEVKLSFSDSRVSWRGLISRSFEMDELDCCNWLPDKAENVDCHAEDQVTFKLDLKSDLQSRSSLSTLINEMDVTKLTNGIVSFDFVDNEQCEQQCKAKGPFCSPISCAESFSMEGDGLAASIDSDWGLFYKNSLFEV